MNKIDLKITVDDLVFEYLMYKVKNGYDPYFSLEEIVMFLDSFEFESDLPIEMIDFFDENSFKKYFENQKVNGVAKLGNLVLGEDDIVRPTYKFSDFDKSLLNTYFMDKKVKEELDFVIGNFLFLCFKRSLVIPKNLEPECVAVGNLVAADMVNGIWKSYVENNIRNRKWPRQCSDIEKYLLETDLASIIEVESIKKELLEFYKDASLRVAALYSEDKDLQISSFTNKYLANANYRALIGGYEELVGIAYGNYKKALVIDLSKSRIEETYALDEVCYYDEEPDVRTDIHQINNEKTVNLVRTLSKNQSRKKVKR